MAKYRTKEGFAPVLEVEATRWFKNGDHPDDYVASEQGFEGGELVEFTGEQRRERGWEGKVVRYFRHPSVDGATICLVCQSLMHDHGWIDQGQNGITVCPGDYVVTIVASREVDQMLIPGAFDAESEKVTIGPTYDVTPPAVFEARFELVPA